VHECTAIGRGSGTIALASAHTSCLRQIVKEQAPSKMMEQTWKYNSGPEPHPSVSHSKSSDPGLEWQGAAL
jgi:hypothetical protein